jgi:spermidine synthase
MSNNTQYSIQKPLIYFFFLLSGATGLVYELIWIRLLGSTLGNTTYAISVVIATFMAGLSLGGYLVGRYLDTHSRPLRLYAILEIGVGAWALLVPFLIKGVDKLHVTIHPLFKFTVFTDSLLHSGLSSLVLLLPTLLMGGTLPALTTYFTKNLSQIGRKLSLLYALNTLGAVVGTCWAGFYAIHWLGVNQTNNLAVITNLVIGGICLLIDYKFVMSPRENESKVEHEYSPFPILDGTTYLVWGIFVTGFSAMVCQIAWTRSLIMVLGSSTYAFTCILIVFLLGIFIGSEIHNRLLTIKTPLGIRDFSVTQILIGTFCLLSLPTFGYLPKIYLNLYHLLPQSSASIQALRLILPLITMIVPTILMGAAFPIAGAAYTRATGHIPTGVGNIYAANTLGNVLGALLTGFFLLSNFGIQNSLKVAIILNLAVGVFGLLVSRPRLTFILAGSAVLIGVLTIIHPPWNRFILNSGVSIYTRDYDPTRPFKGTLGPEKIIYYKEGLSGVVSVYEASNGQRYLKINGKTDASTAPLDMSTQSLLGYLPIFLHPDPQDALVIGLGSGVTASAVAEYDFIRQVDCVEIEPAVVEAASFFEHENHNILKNPRFKIIVGDARGHIQSSPKSYDLIISEPSNPWIKGIGGLFTVDFFNLCRQRINPGGIMCQWIQAYGLTPQMYKMAVNSFSQSFNYCQLWHKPAGDTLIIGSQSPITFDLERIKKLMNYNELVQADMRQHLFLDSPSGLLAYYQLNNEEITTLIKGARLNTDNYPLLEFEAPRSLLFNTDILNYKNIRSYKKNILPPRTKPADLKINLDEYYYSLSQVCLQVNLLDGASRYINKALEWNDKDPRFYLVRGKINSKKQKSQQAINDLQHSLELDSENFKTHLELARIYREEGLFQDAQRNFQRALELAPQDEILRYYYADFLVSQRMYSQALPLIDGLTSPGELKPFKIWKLKGEIHYQLKELDKARTAYEKTLKLNAASYKVKIRLGEIYLAQREVRSALELFQQVDKSLPLPELNLLSLISDCYIYLGEFDNAAEILRKILRNNPTDYNAYKKLSSLPIDQPEDIF